MLRPTQSAIVFVQQLGRGFRKAKNIEFSDYSGYFCDSLCLLLNWENNEVPLNIGGYKYDKKTKTFPVFFNYDKPDDISETTKYEDHFLNAGTLIAISKTGRIRQSEEVQNFLRAKERDMDVHLFVRKNKDDKRSKEFFIRANECVWKC